MFFNLLGHISPLLGRVLADVINHILYGMLESFLAAGFMSPVFSRPNGKSVDPSAPFAPVVANLTVKALETMLNRRTRHFTVKLLFYIILYHIFFLLFLSTTSVTGPHQTAHKA